MEGSEKRHESAIGRGLKVGAGAVADIFREEGRGLEEGQGG